MGWALREIIGTAAVVGAWLLLKVLGFDYWQAMAIYFVIGASFILALACHPRRKPEDILDNWIVFFLIAIWPYAMWEFVVRWVLLKLHEAREAR